MLENKSSYISRPNQTPRNFLFRLFKLTLNSVVLGGPLKTEGTVLSIHVCINGYVKGHDVTHNDINDVTLKCDCDGRRKIPNEISSK